MRIMTFNIQHGLDQETKTVDLDKFGAFIRRQEPDICGLNEVRNAGVRADFTDQPAHLGRVAGMHAYFGEAIRFRGTDPYGNALLSRVPFQKCETFLLPYFKNDRCDETRSVIRAEIALEGGTVTVLAAHFGLTPPEIEHAALTLRDTVRTIRTPVVVMGDFNALPDNPFLQPLRDELRDAHEMNPDADGFTFPSYDPNRKIDYIFYRGLTCIKCTTLRHVVSDHFPILAEFTF